MADFTFVKSLVGDVPEMKIGKAHAALERGDIGYFTSNRIAKVADNAAQHDLVLVMSDASAQDDDVEYMWLDEWVLIEGSVKGTIAAVGQSVHIDVTSNNIKFELDGTTQALARFIVREVTGASTVRATRTPQRNAT